MAQDQLPEVAGIAGTAITIMMPLFVRSVEINCHEKNRLSDILFKFALCANGTIRSKSYNS
jgi:hypothetical protein